MAAFSIMCCANWLLRETAMQSARLILSSLSVLAIAACAPAGEDENERGSSPPLGLEFAIAGDEGQAATPAASVIDLSVEDLRTKLAQGNIRLIDVRRADEVAEGIIPGAEHIALDEFDPAALDLSDGREIVLYCRSGRRSGIAAEALAAHTGEPAQHLEGGILAWQASQSDPSSH